VAKEVRAKKMVFSIGKLIIQIPKIKSGEKNQAFQLSAMGSTIIW